MIYKLKYGNGYQKIQLPPENVLTYVQVVEQTVAGNNRDCLQAALDNPQESPRFSEFVKERKVMILIEDATRDVPATDIFEAISPELNKAKSIEIMMSTGTHSPAAPGNEELMDSLKKVLKKHNIQDITFSIHDSRKPPFDSYGKSSFGNEFFVNPAVKRAEAFVVLSDMKNHYFAGYSNLLKNFVPGVCAYETTERNHAMALEEKSTFGHHPWHPDQNRRDNPLANEMLEGYEKIVSGRPVWALASVSKHGKIIWCQCG
ncbi:MAG: lactate racemase domain-containing protein, partial [Calditrichia bacterium]